MATIIDALGTPAQKQRYVKPMLDAALGRDDGADRARRRLRRRRGHDEGEARRRRRVPARGRQALHHERRLRSSRRTSSTWCSRAPRARARAPRACRCSSCPKFWVEADGSLGERNGAVVTNVEHKMGIQRLGDLRADARRRRAVPRPAARRGPRRHRADVPRHRVRAHGRRHEVDGDAVDGVPQRARLHARAQAGRRPREGRPTRPRRASRSSGTPTCAAC